MEHYDIVIVGGGPAGSSFAKGLSSYSGRVLLLDKRNLTGSKAASKNKPCSGLVATPAQKILNTHGLTIPFNILVRPNKLGIRVVDVSTRRWIEEKDIIQNVDRGLFESWLFAQIPKNIEVRNDTRFVSYSKSEDRLEVIFESQHGQHKVLTKTLIGADGANSKVRRSIVSSHHIPKYTGIEWFIDVGDHKMSPYFHILLDDILSDYYMWSVPKGNLLHVGGAFPSIADSKTMPERLITHLQQLNVLPSNFKTIGMWAHPISRAAKIEDLYFGNGPVHLIGEAAGLICPTSAEGYSYAISSGSNLALQIIKCEEGSYDLQNAKRIKQKLFRKKLIYNKHFRGLFFRLKGQSY